MCWNWEISLITWMVGLGSALYLFRRKNKYDITLGSLILAYSSMQLWEVFMWLDQKCGRVNSVANKLAYFALWSHTLAIGIGLYIEEKIVLPLVIGICFMVLAFVQSFLIDWKCSKPEDGGCRHLVWGFPHKYYIYVFTVCIAICLVCIKPLWKAVVISLLFITSFGLSAIYGKNATGSFWCFVCAVFAPIFILINK